jgi:hypothetical protein
LRSRSTPAILVPVIRNADGTAGARSTRDSNTSARLAALCARTASSGLDEMAGGTFTDVGARHSTAVDSITPDS